MTCIRTISAFGSLRVRTSVGAVASMLAFAGVASPAAASTDHSWVGGSGQWWSNNWDPILAPGFLSSTDIARIGNRPGVQNITVFLGLFEGFAVAPTFDSVFISNGNTLELDGSAFRTTGVTALTGVNTRFIVRPSATILTPYDFQGTLHMDPGTRLQLEDGSRIALDGPTSSSSGLVTGRGRIDFGLYNSVGFRNQGTIEGSNNGGLSLLQSGPGRIDLDGSPAESVEFGQLLLASPFSQLTIQGDSLTDTFSGTVTMGTGSLLTMNMFNGWTADANSTFNVSSSMVGAAAQIDGGHFTFGGDLNIGGSQGHLRVLADATFADTADVFLGTNDRLEFDGNTTVQGGLYNLSAGGRIDFDGATQMGGGVFNLVGNTPSQGAVNFNGDTVGAAPPHSTALHARWATRASRRRRRSTPPSLTWMATAARRGPSTTR